MQIPSSGTFLSNCVVQSFFFFLVPTYLSNKSSLVQLQFSAWVTGQVNCLSISIFLFSNSTIISTFQRSNITQCLRRLWYTDTTPKFPFCKVYTIVYYNNSYLRCDIVKLLCRIRKLIFFLELVSKIDV